MNATANLIAKAPSWAASRMTSESFNTTVLDSNRSILAKDPNEKAHAKTRMQLESSRVVFFLASLKQESFVWLSPYTSIGVSLRLVRHMASTRADASAAS